jgi:hypothetical protein
MQFLSSLFTISFSLFYIDQILQEPVGNFLQLAEQENIFLLTLIKLLSCPAKLKTQN